MSSDSESDSVERRINAKSQKSTAKDTAASKISAPKEKTKGKRHMSEVWEHFTKFSNERGEQKACRKYCGREFCADTKLNGTSFLKAHLKVCVKIPKVSNDPNQTELIYASTEGA